MVLVDSPEVLGSFSDFSDRMFPDTLPLDSQNVG